MRMSVLDVPRENLQIGPPWSGSHPFHGIARELGDGKVVMTVAFSERCPLCRDWRERRLLNTPGSDGPRPAA
jgi:hypothetical protein